MSASSSVPATPGNVPGTPSQPQRIDVGKQKRKSKYICIGSRNQISGRMIKRKNGQWEDIGYDTFNPKHYQAQMKNYERDLKAYNLDRSRPKPKKPGLPNMYYLSLVDGKVVRVDLKRDQKERCLGLVEKCVGEECPNSMLNRREATLQGKRLVPVNIDNQKKRRARKGQDPNQDEEPPRIIGCLVGDDNTDNQSRNDATPFRDFIPGVDSQGRLMPLPPPGVSEKVCDEDTFEDFVTGTELPSNFPVPGRTQTLTIDDATKGNFNPYLFEISLFDFLLRMTKASSGLNQQENLELIRQIVNLDISQFEGNRGLRRIRQFYISPNNPRDYLQQNQVEVDLKPGSEALSNVNFKKLIVDSIGRFSGNVEQLFNSTLSDYETIATTTALLKSSLKKDNSSIILPGSPGSLQLPLPRSPGSMQFPFPNSPGSMQLSLPSTPAPVASPFAFNGSNYQIEDLSSFDQALLMFGNMPRSPENYELDDDVVLDQDVRDSFIPINTPVPQTPSLSPVQRTQNFSPDRNPSPPKPSTPSASPQSPGSLLRSSSSILNPFGTPSVTPNPSLSPFSSSRDIDLVPKTPDVEQSTINEALNTNKIRQLELNLEQAQKKVTDTIEAINLLPDNEQLQEQLAQSKILEKNAQEELDIAIKEAQ